MTSIQLNQDQIDVLTISECIGLADIVSDEATLIALSKRGLPVRLKLLKNKFITADVLTAIMSNEHLQTVFDTNVGVQVFCHAQTKYQDRISLLSVKQVHDRLCATKGESISSDMLASFSQADNVLLRRLAACCSNTPESAFLQLASDPDVTVRCNMAINVSLPTNVAMGLTRDPALVVRRQLASNKRVAPIVLHELANDEDIDIAETIAGCWKAWPLTLLKLMFRTEREISAEAEGVLALTASSATSMDPDQHGLAPGMEDAWIDSELAKSGLSLSRIVPAQSGYFPADPAKLGDRLLQRGVVAIYQRIQSAELVRQIAVQTNNENKLTALTSKPKMML